MSSDTQTHTHTHEQIKTLWTHYTSDRLPRVSLDLGCILLQCAKYFWNLLYAQKVISQCFSSSDYSTSCSSSLSTPRSHIPSPPLHFASSYGSLWDVYWGLGKLPTLWIQKNCKHTVYNLCKEKDKNIKLINWTFSKLQSVSLSVTPPSEIARQLIADRLFMFLKVWIVITWMIPGPNCHLFSETSQHLLTELGQNLHSRFPDDDNFSGQLTFHTGWHFWLWVK